MATVNDNLLGCQAPTQAIFLRPLCILHGNFFVCQQDVTPEIGFKIKRHKKKTSSVLELD
jgi:hypothetical protein